MYTLFSRTHTLDNYPVSTNPFLANVCILYPLKNTQKPSVFSLFSGGIKWEHGQKKINARQEIFCNIEILIQI